MSELLQFPSNYSRSAAAGKRVWAVKESTARAVRIDAKGNAPLEIEARPLHTQDRRLAQVVSVRFRRSQNVNKLLRRARARMGTLHLACTVFVAEGITVAVVVEVAVVVDGDDVVKVE